eukprot:scaffold115849_cov56-Phaeocystis_antarctica.AAC.1
MYNVIGLHDPMLCCSKSMRTSLSFQRRHLPRGDRLPPPLVATLLLELDVQRAESEGAHGGA